MHIIYRFRDTVLLSKDHYQNDGKMLRLSSLIAQGSGTITCRANNPSRAIVSAPVTLSVKGNILFFLFSNLMNESLRYHILPPTLYETRIGMVSLLPGI